MARKHLSQSDLNTLLTLAFTLGGSITVSGAASASGAINLTATAHGLASGTAYAPLWVTVNLVTGTTEANGVWAATIPDANHITLTGSTFTNAYVSGGAAKTITISGGALASVSEDDLLNLADSLRREASAPGSTLGTLLASAT